MLYAQDKGTYYVQVGVKSQTPTIDIYVSHTVLYVCKMYVGGPPT